jgi:CubicO group peptidase (beta-lactamase class C family)
MQAMWNTTFVEVMGLNATNVTVGNLIRMQSGIADFDIPSLDHELLTNASSVHSPLELLNLVASFNETYGCKTYNCTYVCEPGTCTMYSSTNFVIAGLVLLGSAPEG